MVSAGSLAELASVSGAVPEDARICESLVLLPEFVLLWTDTLSLSGWLVKKGWL